MNLFKSLFNTVSGGRSPADLAKWLDLPEAELREWLTNKPAWARGYEYARFSIPKRRGGVRAIEAPNKKLKALQRRILRRLLNPLKFHPAATGFVPGRSIVDNARPHAGRGVVINIDLAEFFPTITAERVTQVFRSLGWGAEAATILTNICAYEGRLPQGAPTSPALSNLICRKLDERFSALVKRYKGQYTRYADDITFSFPGLGRNKRLRPKPKGRPPLARPAQGGPGRTLLTLIKTIVEEEGFRIQMKKKVRVQRPHQRQTATGLVVNRQVNLPRTTRRLIRAMQHRQRLDQLDAEGQRRLKGLEALMDMVSRQRG
ncbi:MAG: RNA-directed DNA polymerase [Chloroflexi bacterium]|nr:RNA-directed DNA polymerase [Chloroflexota bacterium]